jgi:DNA-binding MarR family transcriptional regulator
MTDGSLIGLGTQLRQVLDLVDADVAGVLADLGLADYRPRYSVYLRAVVTLGPVPIRDLARAVGVTHSAASQTLAEMSRRDLVELRPGDDGRQRIVHLTAQARSILATVEAEWDATASAAAELDAELPFPLSDLVPVIAAALERRPFRERIVASAWAREHPMFTAALATAAGERHAAAGERQAAAGERRAADSGGH